MSDEIRRLAQAADYKARAAIKRMSPSERSTVLQLEAVRLELRALRRIINMSQKKEKP